MPYGRDVSPRGVSPGPLSAPSTGVTPRRVVASGGASSREAVEPAGVYKEAFTRLGPAQEEEGDFASYAAPGRTRDPLSQAAAEQRAEMQKIIESTRRQRPQAPGSASSERRYLQVSHTLDQHPIRERRYDLASRLGIMTIEKVAEIEKTLLERFEDTLVAKVAFVAGCFHSWRCEATLYRNSRKVQDEVARLQEEWKSHLSVQLSDHMTEKEQRAARWRQGLRLALGRWALGEDQGLVQRSLRVWRDLLELARQRARTKQAIKSALLSWAGKDVGGLQVCMQSWAAEARMSMVLKRHQEEYRQAELARQAEWSAHLAVQASEHMTAREQEKARWHQGMALAIDRWAHGNLHGLVHRLFTVWRELLESAKRQRKSKPLVLKMMHQWLEGREKGNLHACYNAWRESIAGMKSSEAQRQLKLALEENERLQEIADTQRKEVIARSLRNLGFQSTKMMLLECFSAWSRLYQEAREQWHREVERNEVLQRYAVIVEQSHMKKDAASLKSSVMLEWHKVAHFDKLERLHAAKVDSLAAREAALSQKWQQGIRLALDRWATDDVHGLTHRVLLAWRDVLVEAKRHRQSKDLVMGSMMKWAEGKDRGSLHSCLRLWAAEARAMKELARHQEEYRRAELKMQEDWAAQLAMQSGDHMTAKEQQEARWRQNMALALERWALGSQHGLVLRVLQAWRDLHHNEQKRKPLIQSAMLSWAEGKDKGNLRMCMQVWASETRASKELAAVRSEHALAHTEASKAKEEKWRQAMVLALDRWALGADHGLILAVLQAWRDMVLQANRKRKSKPLIQNVMAQWAEGKEKGTLHTCYKAWRDSIAGIKSVEAQRKLDLALADNARLQELAATQKREVIARSLRSLGFQNDRMSVMECFLAWSAFYQEAREEWHRRMEQNSALEKYALILEQTHLKKDAASLKAAILLEWHKCARAATHDRQHGEHHQTMMEAQQEISELRIHQVSLEEQLQTLYMQLDQVTETLQTELRSKEDLAAELRQAYARWHHASLPTSPMLFGTVNSSTGAGTYGERLDRSEPAFQTDAATSSYLNRSRSTGSIQRPAPNAFGPTSRLVSAVGARQWDSSHINLSASRGSDFEGTDHFSFPKPLFGETVRTPRQTQVYREELTRASTTASVGQTPTKPTAACTSNTPRSPPQCSWDATVARLQDEGILRLDDRRL